MVKEDVLKFDSDAAVKEYLNSHDVTTFTSKEPEGYIDYRKSKKSFNQLTANKRVVGVDSKGNVSTKKVRLEDTGALDMLKKVKPVDTLNAIGKEIRTNHHKVLIIDFDYFVTPKNRTVERYVCSDGTRLRKSQVDDRLNNKNKTAKKRTNKKRNISTKTVPNTKVENKIPELNKPHRFLDNILSFLSSLFKR